MCIVSSILSDKVGIRPTAFVGGLVACVGLIASAFVEQLELLYLTYGLLLGVGSALAYNPSLVILGHYFRKHMGLVNGLVSFGSAISTIALSFAFPRLLESIKIKYTFIFLAGLEFLVALGSLTFKPMITKKTNLAHAALSTESVREQMHECCTLTRKYLNMKIWRKRQYVVWILSLGVGLCGYFVPFFHLVSSLSLSLSLSLSSFL